MSTFDANANLAHSVVTVAPVPAASGTALTVADASPFPVAPFYALAWPPDVCAYLSNSEIVRVTAVVGNVLTIDRAEGGTSAQAIAAGWQIANTLTADVVDQIEAAILALEAAASDAVILHPLTSVRNVINPAGDVIPLSVFGSVGQTEDLFDIGVEPDVAAFRVVPGPAGAGAGAVSLGTGAGTFNPAAYGFYDGSTFVVSQAEDGEYDVNGGPNIVPSGAGYVQTFFDANFVPAIDSPLASVYQYGSSMRYNGTKLVANLFGQYQEVFFRGTKAAGSGNQIDALYGMTSVASADAGSTGDIGAIYGTNSGGYAAGSGEIGVGVFGTYSFIQLGAAGPQIPTAEGLTSGIYSDGRTAVQGIGLHVTEPNGGSNFDHTYGILLDGAGASADAWAIYSGGGKSALLAGDIGVVPLSLIGAAGQTADLLDISIDPGIPFLRVVPPVSLAIGAGTFDPNDYGGYGTTFVISQAEDGWYDALGGPNIVPATSYSQVFLDANFAPTNNLPNEEVFQLGASSRYEGVNTRGLLQGIYSETIFNGTKTAGSGIQVDYVYGVSGAAQAGSGSTGDIDSFYGVYGVANQQGSGDVATGLYALLGTAALGSAVGTKIPTVEAVWGDVSSGGRDATQGIIFHGAAYVGGSNFDHTYGIYLDSMISGSADAWAIRSLGGKSQLDAGAATVIPLTVRGAAAQSANLFVAENSAGTDLVAITAAGVIAMASQKITGLANGSASDDAAAFGQIAAGDAASVILLPTTDARNVIQPSAATVTPLTIKGFTAQSDNLQEFQDSTGVVLAAIGPTGYEEMLEQTAPSTPAANRLRLFARDSGAGKTQLVVKFESGNTVVIAEDF